MFRQIVPLSALLLSFMVLCLGHGLQSVLLPARAAIEAFSEVTTGLLMSGYFAGFILGTYVCPKLIHRVGHIRVFAAAAAVASSILILHSLIVNPVIWIALRVLYGLAMVHLYTVMESWLNGVVEREHRGRLLSIYMIVNFVSMSLGQLLFFIEPAESYASFSIAGMMLSLSLLPLILSRIKQPEEVAPAEAFGLKALYRISPLGVMGALIAGLIGSAYWGLSALFILKAGYTQQEISLYMFSSFLGGLAAQWPLGLASDKIGRRIVIAIACILLTVSSAFLGWIAIFPLLTQEFGRWPLVLLGIVLGSGLHPLYSLCIAHTNDFVPASQFVRASTGLQLVQSIGAVTGAPIAGALMAAQGHQMLHIYTAVLSAALFFYTLARMLSGHTPNRIKPFRIFTRLGMLAPRMDPRIQKP